jgi:hypothetical protein
VIASGDPTSSTEQTTPSERIDEQANLDNQISPEQVSGASTARSSSSFEPWCAEHFVRHRHEVLANDRVPPPHRRRMTARSRISSHPYPNHHSLTASMPTQRPETFADLLRTKFADEDIGRLCRELGVREAVLERMRRGVTRMPRRVLREALARVLDVPVERVTAACRTGYAERMGEPCRS